MPMQLLHQAPLPACNALPAACPGSMQHICGCLLMPARGLSAQRGCAAHASLALGFLGP